MKLFFALLTGLLIAASFTACNNSASTTATFCDTACVKDSIKFMKADDPLKPYVYLSADNCKVDSITWSYTDLGKSRTASIVTLFGRPLQLNKDAVSCFIKDTSYAWLSFNDCSTGRGFLLKLNYKRNVELKSSALNAFDKKFSVEDGLIAYSDRGNLFAEDMKTGEKATMTFGERIEIDYDAVHDKIDSIHVTRTKLWAKVKVGDDWKVFEKAITLK